MPKNATECEVYDDKNSPFFHKLQLEIKTFGLSRTYGCGRHKAFNFRVNVTFNLRQLLEVYTFVTLLGYGPLIHCPLHFSAQKIDPQTIHMAEREFYVNGDIVFYFIWEPITY